MTRFQLSLLGALLTLLTACQAKLAKPAASDGTALIPIAIGAYVDQDKGCADRAPLFRYDGRSMGWSGSGSAERPMYPIVRVRKEQDQWVATILAPGPGVDGHKTPRELDVYIVPREAGRITITAMERDEMKLCPIDALPAWAR